MARFTYCVVTLIVCQGIAVFARPQFDYDQYDFNQFGGANDNFGNQQQQLVPAPGPQPETTTITRNLFARPRDPTVGTTAIPPNFTACIAQCPVTQQYNPVCGTNGQNYNNVSRLRCAQQCGLNVEVQRSGTCGISPGGK